MGLILFSLKALRPDRIWKTKFLSWCFWGINIGLFAMTVLSLLPIGLLQTWASVEHSYWYARSAEFMQQPIMNTLRWWRVPGDIIFAAGALGFVFFVFTCHTNLFSDPRPKGK
jgi:nitric oxide reductase subunit B